MISVVMAYHDRPDHLKNTLDSYNYFYKDLDFEVIVIEDTSKDAGKSCAKVLSKSGIPFKHECIDRSHKEYRNPGVLYNRAVEIADGEVIHITNPENLHLGPILSHCLDHITDDNYIVYACRTLRLLPPSFHTALSAIEDMTNWDEANGWYQHSQIYNRLLHFASVIKKDTYIRIGGFDPRFDDGVGYEDNDFIRRVKDKCLDVITFDDPLAAHQSHDRGHWSGKGLMKNCELYQEIWSEAPIEHWR